MSAGEQVRRQASREVWRNYPFRIRCRIIEYRPFAEPAPTCVVIPYAAFKTYRYETRDEWLEENSYEFPVNFPGNNVFHVDPERYDAFVDSPIQYAIECYPVPTTEYRAEQARVPDGWTEEEVVDQSIDPDSIQMRIVRGKQKIESLKGCAVNDAPLVARQFDVWNGPIRQKLDRGLVDIWAARGRLLARYSGVVSSVMSQRFNFPMCDGISVGWGDRTEHPFQRHFGSSAVVNYPRFLYTMGVDPGYIIGVVMNVVEFIRSLEREQEHNGHQVVTYTTYEVIDYRDEVPEV